MRYEVQQSYLVDPFEDCCDPGKMDNLEGPGRTLEESNKYCQIVSIDCSLGLEKSK
jgi:hypothetical protein